MPKLRSLLVLSVITLLGWGSVGSTAQAALYFVTEDDGVESPAFSLDIGDTSSTFVDLKFGTSSGAQIRYDVAGDDFLVNRDLDLQANEIVDFKLERLAAAPTCNAGSEGRMYFNTTDGATYVCDGLVFNLLEAGALEKFSYQGELHAGVDSLPLTADVGDLYFIDGAGNNFGNIEGDDDLSIGDVLFYSNKQGDADPSNPQNWVPLQRNDDDAATAAFIASITAEQATQNSDIATNAADIAGLATVANSGDYNDLTNLPTLGTAADNDEGDFVSSSLTSANILVGNSFGVATEVSLSGDATIDNLGALTINDDAVDGTDIALTSEATGSLMYNDGTDWVNLGIGTAGHVLQVNTGATAPEWAAASGHTQNTDTGTDSNTFTLDNDDTGGDVDLIFGATNDERLTWDNANARFSLTDDLVVGGVLQQDGNTFTLDADNTGAGANVSIVAEQGTDNNGELRYNATSNEWELSNDGGAFGTIAVEGAHDHDEIVDADGDTKIQVEEGANDNTIRFDTFGTERMVLNPIGNLGLGTSSPAGRFDARRGGVKLVQSNSFTDGGGSGCQAGQGNVPLANTVGLRVNDTIEGNTILKVSTGPNYICLSTDPVWLGGQQKSWIGANGLYLNGSNGAVGIGTATPQTTLDVQGEQNIAGTLNLATQTTAVLDGEEIGRLSFNTPLESDGGDAILAGAAIWAEADATFDATTNNTELVFGTATSSAAVEQMRLDADGNLGIGTDAPSEKLDVEGNIELNSNQLLAARIENAASITCDASNKGRLYIDNDDDLSYVCDGTSLKQIDAAGGGHTQNTDTGTDSNTFTLDNDDTGGDVDLIFGTTNDERLTWDNTNGRFNVSDDVRVGGNLELTGGSLTLDADNAGPGFSLDIVANQGEDLDGTLRYDGSFNEWRISNNGGAFEPVATRDTDQGSIESVFTLDSDNTGAGANVSIVAEQGTDNNGELRYNATSNEWELSNDGGAFAAISTGGGIGDITAVGSMTTGDAFADATADDDWLGLGAAAGRIEFDDQATDEVNILNANVGINTDAPQSLLDVQGEAGAAGILTLASKETSVLNGDELGRIQFNAPLESDGSDSILPGAALWAVAEYEFGATRNDTELVFGTATSSTPIERMRLDADGNLGVGAFQPAGRLDVRRGEVRTLSANSYTDTFGLICEVNQGVVPLTDVSNIQVGDRIGPDIYGGYIISEVTGSNVCVYTNPGWLSGEEKVWNGQTGLMLDAASGKVGVATTSPQSDLDVQGRGSTPGTLTLATQDTEVTDGDQLGRINFNAPLESDGGDALLAASAIWSEADINFNSVVNASELVFATATTSAAIERMRLDSAGNLGIGTSTPSTKLDVEGHIRLNGYSLLEARIENANSITCDVANRGRIYFDLDDSLSYVCDGSTIKQIDGGAGGGSFAALSDTDFGGGPGDAEIAIFDNGSGNWENQTLSGDAAIDNTGAVTIQADSVALTTDTTGNYVQSLADAGSGDLTITNGVAEGGAATIDITDDALDFTELADAMEVDATTTFDLDTNSADLNFDSDTLVIDSSANSVGVGTASPTGNLNVHGGAGSSQIFIDTNANVGAGNSTSLFFQSDTDGTPNPAGLGQFNDGALRFTAAGNLVVPDMMINDDGSLFVGATAETISGATLDGVGDVFVADELGVEGAIYTDATATKYQFIDIFGCVRGSASAGTVASGNSPVVRFDAAGNSQMRCSFAVPDDWQSGTDIDVEVYYSPSDNTAGDVKFVLRHAAKAVGETIAGGDFTDTLSGAETVAINTQLDIYELTGDIPAASLALDDMVNLNLRREPGDAADTYGGDINIHMIRLAYTGKRLE